MEEEPRDSLDKLKESLDEFEQIQREHREELKRLREILLKGEKIDKR